MKIDAVITLTIDELNAYIKAGQPVSVSVVPPPLTPVPPSPVPVPVPSPGHMVTVDPPFSVTGQATMFGLNWDGSTDASDNGIGFFTDPATGKSYDTRNKTLAGCSLPREVMLSTFLGVDDWKTSDINSVWSHHAASVQAYVTANKPLLTMDSGGKSAIGVPLVDAGPTAATGNALDLTYAVAHQLGTDGKALTTYEIIVTDKPIEIKGWGFKEGKVT